MDQSALSARNRVEKEVLDTIIRGLNSGELKVDNASQVAKETLIALDDVSKHEENILNFYKRLAARFQSFNILYAKAKNDFFKSKEMSAYRQALSAIQTGDVNEAHKIANLAINQSAHEATNSN